MIHAHHPLAVPILNVETLTVSHRALASLVTWAPHQIVDTNVPSTLSVPATKHAFETSARIHVLVHVELMPFATLSIIHLFALASTVILETPSRAVIQRHNNNTNHHRIRVTHHHADRTHNATTVFVLALLSITETRIQAVAQNVFSIRTVHEIRPAFVANVLIRVPELAL